MSLIWMDGFENSSLWSRKYQQVSGTFGTNMTAAAGRNGNCMAIAASNTNQFKRVLPSADTHATMILGFAMRTGTAWDVASSRPFLELGGDSGGTAHLRVIFQSGGAGFNVYRLTTLLGSTAGISFSSGTWYYVEVKATLGDSPTGAVEVRVNGTSYLTLTSQDTKNAGTGSVFDSFQFGAGASANQSVDIDDLYLCNGAGSVYNDFLGDVTVETIRPDGNGNSSQFVGSDSNSTDNYLLVDESTYSAADYVQSGTTNNKDLYTYGALAASTGTVKGVMALGVMQKTASAAQSARQITRVSGVNYNGASTALSTSDVVYGQAWEQSPATATDWTISEVNGAEFGVEVL